MGSKIEYVESSHVAASDYVRNSKAVGVLWAMFSICYALVSSVVLLTPEWIGSAAGRAGVWQVCGAQETCEGRLDSPASLPGAVFRAAALLVAVAALLSLIAVTLMLLFFFCRSTTVFHICGWLHLLSGLSMALGAALYPAAWDAPAAASLCGPAVARYSLGECSVRWTYVLAGLACLDAGVLAALAFVLATRHVRLHPDSPYNNTSLYLGETATSRKTLCLQPAQLRDDVCSQYSRRTAPHYRL